MEPVKAALRAFVGSLPVVCLTWTAAAAQPYPSKPVQLIVPFAAGAAFDTTARIIADGVKDGLGSVIVDNRPGGNATIAAAFVKRAAPDGHTLLLAGNNYVVAEAIDIPRQHDLFEDFEPVVRLADLPFYLVVNREKVPVSSLREFVEYVRKRPGRLDYITPGIGTTHHFAMEALKLETGLHIVHVPYKSMGHAVGDMLAGRVDMTITGFPAVASHMKTGKLRILGTIGSQRSSLQPDVPTFAEAGVAGVQVVSWIGIVVRKGTPEAVVARLNDEFNRALKKPEVRALMAKQGLDIVGGAREPLAKMMRADYEKFRRIVRETGIKPE